MPETLRFGILLVRVTDLASGLTIGVLLPVSDVAGYIATLDAKATEMQIPIGIELVGAMSDVETARIGIEAAMVKPTSPANLDCN